MTRIRQSVGLALVLLVWSWAWTAIAQDAPPPLPVPLTPADPSTAVLVALLQGGSVGPMLVGAVGGLLLRGWVPTLRVVHVHEGGVPAGLGGRDVTEEAPRRG